ncbi:MAG: hypothetical protein IJD93_00690 [Ruminococcus sp.]|nr:hypothetical protein [Ruminococcus sp.]MBQ4283207.1 hypothetical protein [Lachnospira sp.]
MTNSGINLFKVILIVFIGIFVILSFLNCVVCIEQSSIELDLGDGPFTTTHITDRFYDNACWLILVLSISLVFLLKFNKKLIRDIREVVSLLMALVTTAYPIYLFILYPGFFGNSYGYVWTPIGYVELALSWFIFLYNIVLLRIIDKKMLH